MAGTSGYACDKCDVIVAENRDLKKHMKECHPRTVAICRKFVEGKCNLPDKSCWFLHVEQDFENKIAEDKATLDEASDVIGKNDNASEMNVKKSNLKCFRTMPRMNKTLSRKPMKRLQAGLSYSKRIRV